MQPGTALAQLARWLGVMAVPCVTGTMTELCAWLQRDTQLEPAERNETQSSSSSSTGAGGEPSHMHDSWAETPEPPLYSPTAHAAPKPAAAASEGWVVTGPDGTRHKLVHEVYKRSARALQALHPLMVWDAVRRCGLPREQLAAWLPAHGQQELGAILDALQTEFCCVQQALAALLRQPGSSYNASTSRTRAAACGRARCSYHVIWCIRLRRRADSGAAADITVSAQPLHNSHSAS